MNAQQLKEQVNELFISKEYDAIKSLLLSYKTVTEHDNDLAVTCYLCIIYEQEKSAGQATLFSKVSDMTELLERYTALKFHLRRLDFHIADDLTDFRQFLIQNRISSYELLKVMDFSTIHKNEVLQMIQNNLPQSAESTDDINESDNRYFAEASSQGIYPQEIYSHEICFIICTNQPAYAEECIYYIRHLSIPEGIHVDILTIEDAVSLTAAYNEAMNFSKAKYKVYLHHDTFIINPDFINDCLNIFKSSPQIGMIGNVGVKTMPASGMMWDTDRYGMVYEQHIYETQLLANAIDPNLPYLETEAIDGFIMITQYDIPWREDLFTKWDFYDCSQSMEFIKRGYKVIVPNMKQPWCVHDCGFVNLQNYDTEKNKFIAEYLADRREE